MNVLAVGCTGLKHSLFGAPIILTRAGLGTTVWLIWLLGDSHEVILGTVEIDARHLEAFGNAVEGDSRRPGFIWQQLSEVLF